MRKLVGGDSIELGVCYYPEHWPKENWEPDLKRMLSSGLRTVRIAEFAWSIVEPAEGVFCYSFFDEFLDLAEEIGMQVIFCTPTATPPAWLTHKYPETLNCDMDGNPIYHGGRRHYNYNSLIYREKSRIITEKFAGHYAGHPAIVGWQLDNEFNCENDNFYSGSDTLAFRAFLKKKYSSIQELNQAWGTVFWNQTYTKWEEVFVPRRTNADSVNPHLMLDYYRFISDSVCSFAKEQADIIRKYKKKNDFITTNGIFGKIDYQRMKEESLDVMMYDSYPNFAYCLDSYDAGDFLKDRHWSRNLAEVRAISENFGIMEQQSGANGWNTRMEAPSPKPGQMTLWTMQSIAHGADYVSFFRWRTATFGTEMYWHGILDYSGRDNRRLREVCDLAKKVEKLQELSGSRYAAKVGIIKDYDNIWDSWIDRWHGRVCECSENALVNELHRAQIPFDYVYMEKATAEKMAGYEVLFCPHASILTKERIKLLTSYVENGGILIFGCRTGYKEEHGKCVTDYLPGLAAELCQTDILEYSFVSLEDGQVMADWNGTKMEVAVFQELLTPLEKVADEKSAQGTPKGEILARYLSGPYQGEAALILSTYGQGKVFYFGGAFSSQTVGVFLDKLQLRTPWQHIVKAPKTCEIAVRRKVVDGKEKSYLFVLNFEGTDAKIQLEKPCRDLLSGKELSKEIVLGKYETLILDISEVKAEE